MSEYTINQPIGSTISNDPLPYHNGECFKGDCPACPIKECKNCRRTSKVVDVESVCPFCRGTPLEGALTPLGELAQAIQRFRNAMSQDRCFAHCKTYQEEIERLSKIVKEITNG